MADISYKVLKDYGTIADHNGLQLKLQLISWNGKPAKLDLRAWRNGYAMGGIAMTKDELETLGIYINEQNLRKPVADMPKLTVSTPIAVEQPKKKRGRPAKNEPTKKVDVVETKKEEKKETKKNVIEFPKAKPPIEKMVTDGRATYAECIEKIEGFKKIYVDSDSQYVLDGILELCKVDKDFRNNVMRADKDFEGALDYMADMCKKGYGYKKSNYGFVNRDAGLGFTIDYFNLDPKSLKPAIPQTTTATPKTSSKKKIEKAV